MSAASEKQAHLARMAKAYLHGHARELPKGALSKVKQFAEMGEAKVEEYMHTKAERQHMLRKR